MYAISHKWFFHFKKFNINGVVSIYFDFNEFHEIISLKEWDLKFFHFLNMIFYNKMIENILINFIEKNFHFIVHYYLRIYAKFQWKIITQKIQIQYTSKYLIVNKKRFRLNFPLLSYAWNCTKDFCSWLYRIFHTLLLI